MGRLGPEPLAGLPPPRLSEQMGDREADHSRKPVVKPPALLVRIAWLPHTQFVLAEPVRRLRRAIHPDHRVPRRDAGEVHLHPASLVVRDITGHGVEAPGLRAGMHRTALQPGDGPPCSALEERPLSVVAVPRPTRSFASARPSHCRTNGWS